ncbi:hypothetical protein VCHA54P489_450001 [Vibrio chagasii]|nr:hypothetical protein VCHA54P489_450001 [Vibrio chagasii]CAH7314413.1 hypothetical protein VCHA49P380_440004 [Vibrio chagasii]CAH7330966.1 hypothetical protein VCHA37P202_470004 [Vibrio chagasii]
MNFKIDLKMQVSILALIVSLVALVLNAQTNIYMSEQNKLVIKERHASFKPDLYVGTTPYDLHLSKQELQYVLKQENGNTLRPNVGLPVELVNLGQGVAKDIQVSFDFNVDLAIEPFRKSSYFDFELVEGKVRFLSIEEQKLYNMGLRSDGQLYSYLLPWSDSTKTLDFYIPSDYVILHTGYRWLEAFHTEKIPVEYKFPPLTVSFTYYDLENNKYTQEFKIGISRELSIYFPERNGNPQKSIYNLVVKKLP